MDVNEIKELMRKDYLNEYYAFWKYYENYSKGYFKGRIKEFKDKRPVVRGFSECYHLPLTDNTKRLDELAEKFNKIKFPFTKDDFNDLKKYTLEAVLVCGEDKERISRVLFGGITYVHI